MSLLFADGFDLYSAAQITRKWDGANYTTGEMVTGRDGVGQAFWPKGTTYTWKILPSNYQTVILGFSIKFEDLTSHAAGLIYFNDGDGTTQVTIDLDTSGHIEARRANSGTLLGTSTFAFSAGTWYTLEVKVKVDNTTGTVDVYVDGVSVLALTGQDTQDNANAYCNRIYIRQSGTANACYFDDLYILAVDATTPNDFLGKNFRIRSIVPNADGTYEELSPSAGTDHYALVDEIPPTDDTDYIQSATVNQRDSFNFAALTINASSILAVQANILARRIDATARSIQRLARIGGSDYASSDKALSSTSFLYYLDMMLTNPATSGAWSASAIDDAEFGLKVSA